MKDAISIRLARWTGIAAVSYLFAFMVDNAIDGYNQRWEEHLRLMRKSEELSVCCQDTTRFNATIVRTYSIKTAAFDTAFATVNGSYDTTVARLNKARWLRVVVAP